METILSPKTAVRRNAPCPCGSGKRYKHCHGAIAAIQPFSSFAPNRFAEFEARMFAAAEASADPAVRLNNRINRLIMEGKSREAAALLIQELRHFLPTNAARAFGMRTATSIQRLVIGNSHASMRNADAADIEEACGVPVVLADLIVGRGMEYLSPGTLVILTGHTDRAEPDVLRAIKAHSPSCIAWLGCSTIITAIWQTHRPPAPPMFAFPATSCRWITSRT